MAHDLITRSGHAVQQVRNRVVTLSHAGIKWFPVPTVIAGLSFVGLERLGARASKSRTGRRSLVAIAAMMAMIGPAAAQANCSDGVLGFLTEIQEITIQGAGLILFALIAAAAILKALPIRGTNSAGNVVIGGVIVAIVFYVVGPAVVDIASTFSPIDMSQGCTVGDGGGG